MKAQELSIGSLVRVNKDVCIKKGTIVEIRQIDADNTFEELRGCAFCRPLDKKQFGGRVWLDYLDPIPLTPEILEKNGFEIRGRKKYFLVPNDPSLAIKREPIIGAHGNTFTIGHFWEGEKDFRWFIEISFIHELQHALRLCGIEKEIVL